MDTLDEVLERNINPALLIGNGINQYNNHQNSSWNDLLRNLATSCNIEFAPEDLLGMSNTEFFDILDLGKPSSDRGSLQRAFCKEMETWRPSGHHTDILKWAQKYNTPVITVNFDENLSLSVDANFYRGKDRFTDFYPWTSYFANKAVHNPRSSFAIWHAHGMMKYYRSIRLGLTHYMGSVQRARKLIYNKGGVRACAKEPHRGWSGENTWLDAFFFCPLIVMGFGFGKDETFFRWLFLERARLYKLEPNLRQSTWFIDTASIHKQYRKVFLKNLGIQYISMDNYSAIYEAHGWKS